MELSLQRATPEHLPVIEAFRRDLYAHDPEAIDESRDRATLLQLMNQPAVGWALLVMADDRCAGYVLVTFCFSVEFAGRFALVDELYVAPEWRRSGVGIGVLEKLDEQLRRVGVRAIRLEVERTNLAAWRLYRRHGFEAHDRRLMTKWLGEAEATQQIDPDG